MNDIGCSVALRAHVRAMRDHDAPWRLPHAAAWDIVGLTTPVASSMTCFNLDPWNIVISISIIGLLQGARSLREHGLHFSVASSADTQVDIIPTLEAIIFLCAYRRNTVNAVHSWTNGAQLRGGSNCSMVEPKLNASTMTCHKFIGEGAKWFKGIWCLPTLPSRCVSAAA